MPGILFQELPFDILLLIFDYLKHGTVVSLALCRSLKLASDAYLRQHPAVHLTKSGVDRYGGLGVYLIDDFAEQVACNRSVALSIQKIRVELPFDSLRNLGFISDKARNSLEHAIRFKPDRHLFVLDALKNKNNLSKWLPLILLTCKNLETVLIDTKEELGWLDIAQHLEYIQWPYNCLTHLDISWTNNRDLRPMYSFEGWRQHDLQDIWLLVSAPTLKSIILNGLEQDNSLYAGAADRAAIRTVYWPVELEILSLHHIQHGQRNDTQDLPILPSRSPFAHEFVHLDTFKVRNFSAPTTWLPILLCSFKSLRVLNISIDSNIIWRGRPDFPVDFQSLKIALHQLAATLEEVRLDVIIPYKRAGWMTAAIDGYISVGSLDQLLQLRILSLPWFACLPCKDLNEDPHGIQRASKVKLAPKLEILRVSGCHLASAGLITELVTVALLSQESQAMKRITLQGNGDFTFKQTDYAHLVNIVDGVEIMFEELG